MKVSRLILALVAVSSPAYAQTDGSGTVTAAGVSQSVFQANVNRSYLECQNPLSATEALLMNIDAPATAAGGAYELAAGGSIRFAAPAFVPNGVINVSAATAGHRFICKQR